MWERQKSSTSSTRVAILYQQGVNLSPLEVNKFSNMSQSWWDPQQNPLISMNAIRMEYIQQQMIQFKKEQEDMEQTNTGEDNSNDRDDSNTTSSFGTVSTHSLPLNGFKALDVGCGGGLLSESLARLGAHVTAIDPSMELVQQAQQHARLHPVTSTNIMYRGGCTVEQLAQEAKENSFETNEESNNHLFDIICLLEVIEHVTDVESILQATESLLKPNTGRLFISTLNRTVASHLVAIVGAEYVFRYLPPGTHNWDQFQSPEELHHTMTNLSNNNTTTTTMLRPLHTSGMVMTALPPIWNWKLDLHNTGINWIGTYQRTRKQ
ncbi:2-polyprenyl-3-methyl-5-hydroxy-6-metoxy-1,4-benzoquinol methylase [Nitzschia inconspicua]|uniref:2-polyprenyl-3-methyl-5-hydroxy-6-metoxy-1, 4-benzoquinol methylase n=1 Tax=Nitzschia inconspicua TaxID=303405 RepID=A0A9K3PAC4_9STRA|nr:2-polyprenyl-3-methyl-5-hydroxy-6-metoxy-1,4-benzoquinol methylase [Nitzschia inconspicua]